MSQIDGLELLSNKDLRQKCIEQGLPNVPVTDSSRNVLIKKLRVSLSGGPDAAKKPSAAKNRRETINVAANKVYPSIEAVKEATPGAKNDRNASPGRAANRRTIAVAPVSQAAPKAAPPKPEIVSPAPAPAAAAPITARRRSTRDEPLPIKPKFISDIVTIEDDDEDDDVLMAAARRVEEVNARYAAEEVPARSRSSRSVSLTKTGVLTTSYQQELAPVAVPSIAEYEESDSGAADILNDKSRAYERYATNFSSQANSTARPMPRHYTTVYNRSSPPPLTNRYTLSSSNLGASTLGASTLGASTLGASTLGASNLGARTLGAYTFTASQMQDAPLNATSLYRNTEQSSDYYSPTANLRRTTVTSYSNKPTNTNTYYAEQSDDTDINNDDDVEDETQEAFDTPFLSNYARSLERMKTEPLSGGYGGAQNEIARRFKSSSSSAYQSPVRRPKIGSDSSEVSLREVLLALGRKYQLKRNLAILVGVLLLVFLFVLFWQ